MIELSHEWLNLSVRISRAIQVRACERARRQRKCFASMRRLIHAHESNTRELMVTVESGSYL